MHWIFLLLSLSLFADERVLLYNNWTPHIEDPAHFAFDLEQKNLPFLSHLSKALAEKNFRLEGTNFEEYLAIADRPKHPSFLQKLQGCFSSKIALPHDLSTIILWNVGANLRRLDFSKFPKERMVLFMWEPPIILPWMYRHRTQNCFSKVFTWNDALVDNKKYFKFHYPVLQPIAEILPSFKMRKLCTLINSKLQSDHPLELYSERKKVIEFFEAHPEESFDFYGKHWEGAGYKNYRGAPQDKQKVLQSYRFCYCYENAQGLPGYITEKIFDCFAAGTIPIYWGAPNITDYIPKECFIDRHAFGSDSALLSYLKNMTEEEYLSHLSHIRRYLASDRAQLFSQEHFIKTLLNVICH